MKYQDIKAFKKFTRTAGTNIFPKVQKMYSSFGQIRGKNNNFVRRLYFKLVMVKVTVRKFNAGSVIMRWCNKTLASGGCVNYEAKQSAIIFLQMFRLDYIAACKG